VESEKETGAFSNYQDAFIPHSMLYQTPYPQPSQFHPLPSSSSSSSISLLLLPTSLHISPLYSFSLISLHQVFII